MNKQQHLKVTKHFLLRLVNHRKLLVKKHANRKMTNTMIQTMKELPYLVERIHSFDQMMRYLNRHEIRVKIQKLIPSNKEAWQDEFDELLTMGDLLTTQNSHLLFTPSARGSRLEAQR